MRSIQRHLVIRLLATVLSVAAVVGLFLYIRSRARLVEGFDQALTAKARALEAMILRQPDGALELNPLMDAAPEFRSRRHATYYEVWKSDGMVVTRSPSLHDHNLALLPISTDSARLQDIQLPDGDGRARAVVFRFVPALDADDEGTGPVRSVASTATAQSAVTLVVAQDRHELDETLWMLGSSLLMGAALLAIGTIVAIIATVRRGMQPLRELASRTSAIDAGSLHCRLPTAGVPHELRPVYSTLNDLLTRLNDAFARQRRFTADAAHELRTPIAELRSLTEVALKYPEDTSPPQIYRDGLAIANQMESLVGALLGIARCESGTQPIRVETFELREIVRNAWKVYEREATEKNLVVQFSLAPAPIRSDRTLLVPLVSNLLSNAIHHTRKHGHVDCRIIRRADSQELVICNTCDNLQADDLHCLFEPFWRKDVARSSGVHAGLGLSLVAAYAAALRAPVRAALIAPDVFQISIALRATGSEIMQRETTAKG